MTIGMWVALSKEMAGKKMHVTLKDIVQAYRLAKIDAWYFHTLNIDEFVRFEENFEECVADFSKVINTPVSLIEFTPEWLGSWRLQPKGIKPKKNISDTDDTFDDLPFSSEPMENFSPETIEGISFRLMATPTPEFHILSSLWLSKVGYLFDHRLPKESYGNRLRRRPPEKISTNGHFRYYVHNFKKWRVRALDAVVKCLNEAQHDSIVVTADAKSFFHALSPDFLLSEEYLRKIGVTLTEEQRCLTMILIKAINAWALNTPLKTGLPVGLPASSVIANAAFLELDLQLTRNINGILSYGRYVDDILIVLDDTPRMQRKSAVWNKLNSISDDLLKLEYEGKIVKRVAYQPVYSKLLTQSQIVFEGEKCKVFSLRKKTGMQFVNILQKQIAEVSSEFRLLPQNVGEDITLQEKIQSLVTGSGESADNFRKIDSLRLRKSDFSGLLLEMEFYAQALQLREWAKPMRDFFKLCNQYVMSLPIFLDFADKLPRIISLATLCGNFMQISGILESLHKIFQNINKVQHCFISNPEAYRDASLREAVSRSVELKKNHLKDFWLKPLCGEIYTTIVSSFGVFDDQASNRLYKKSYQKWRRTISKRLKSKGLPQINDIVSQVRLYLSHDLAHTRYIDHLYQKPFRPNSTHSQMGKYDVLINFGYDFEFQESKWFDDKLIASALRLSELSDKSIQGEKWVPFALLFPTRPIKGDDLFWVKSAEHVIEDGNILVHPYRGYYPNLPRYNQGLDKNGPSLKIENIGLSNPRLALVSLRTEEYEALTEFKRFTKYRPLKRLNAIIKIVNSILREKERVSYILFHELSVPHKWFLPIARRCANSGVSVIAGVDYIKDAVGNCSNQVWMSLVMRSTKGFPAFYFNIEDKEILAYDEQSLLSKYKIVQSNAPKRKHNIIVHGNFAFSTLICSEILDIRNRARLRGLIDALFILAWNQDHSSFAPIIESSALDLHAYIVQCNNNKYGDSRVRIPGKEPWNRDIVRVRGGEDPYYVTVTLEVDKLREFQMAFIEPKKGDVFKPLPHGFKDVMAEYRKKRMERL